MEEDYEREIKTVNCNNYGTSPCRAYVVGSAVGSICRRGVHYFVHLHCG